MFCVRRKIPCEMQNDLEFKVNTFKSKILTEYFHWHIQFHESGLEQFFIVYGIKWVLDSFKCYFKLFANMKCIMHSVLHFLSIFLYFLSKVIRWKEHVYTVFIFADSMSALLNKIQNTTNVMCYWRSSRISFCVSAF